MKILLIDDHRLFAQTLKNLLESKGIKEVFINTDGNFFKQPYLSKTDLILCDLMIPQTGGGLGIIEYIRKTLKKDIPIIILSGFTDTLTIKKAMRMDVNGFLSKDIAIEELMEAIRAVSAGEQYIERRLKDELVNTIFNEEKVSYYLTAREKDVLQYICGGLSIKEVGSKMSLSPHTVQYYYKGLMRKLKLSKMSELIVFAINNGLYDPDTK